MQETESMTRTSKGWATQLALLLPLAMLASSASAATFSVATQGSNITWQTGESILPIVPNLPTSPATSLRWRPNGYPTIMGTGSGPVSLTIAPGLVDQSATPFILPAPTVPTYVQFTTGLSAYVPQAGSTATFKPGAKASRPANFSWCPGAAANPACTTALTGGTQGTAPGLIRYTAGTTGPQFGGTMAVLAFGRFTWVTVEQTLPTYRVSIE